MKRYAIRQHHVAGAEDATSGLSVAGPRQARHEALSTVLNASPAVQRLASMAVQPPRRAPIATELPDEATAPTAAGCGPAIVQRVRFTLGRESENEPFLAERQAAILAQNHHLRGVTDLYVAPGPAPTHAESAPFGGAVRVVLVPGSVYPRDDIFAEDFKATFNGEFYSYQVQLVSHPDVVPVWGAPADLRQAEIARRLHPPYLITRVSQRGGGTGMGRPLPGPQRWGINPHFGGVVAHRQFQSQAELIAWGIHELGLPMEDCDPGAASAGMLALPAPASQPFVFYVHPDTPRLGQPGDQRSVISIAEFERRFDRAEHAGAPIADQRGLSKAPSVGRQDAGSERDPGTVMGASQPGRRRAAGRLRSQAHWRLTNGAI